MAWWRQLGVRSNDRAVANARTATTLLSRRRVERDEVEIYLRGRHADRPVRLVPVVHDAAADAVLGEVAR